jgi:hypothetical protein
LVCITDQLPEALLFRAVASGLMPVCAISRGAERLANAAHFTDPSTSNAWHIELSADTLTEDRCCAPVLVWIEKPVDLMH